MIIVYFGENLDAAAVGSLAALVNASQVTALQLKCCSAIKNKSDLLTEMDLSGKLVVPTRAVALSKLLPWFSNSLEALMWDCAIYWTPPVLITSAASPELQVAFSRSRWCDPFKPPPSHCINNCKSGFISGCRGRLETNSGFLLRTETLWFVSCFHFSHWTKHTYFRRYSSCFLGF